MCFNILHHNCVFSRVYYWCAPYHVDSREDTALVYSTLINRPESCAMGVGVHSNHVALSLLPRAPVDHQLPPTPALSMLNNNRLTSSHNQRITSTAAAFKPTKKPKTPALTAIDSRSKSFHVGGNAPSIPLIGNTQLPPIEGVLWNGSFSTTVGGPVLFPSDRPPSAQLRVSAQPKNRVTFNSRMNRAANYDIWPYISGAADQRPSTTSNLLISVNTPQQKLPYSIGRKVSDNNLHLGDMQVVGHAAGVHGGGRCKELSSVIVEDEEIMATTRRSYMTIEKPGSVRKPSTSS